MNVLKITRLEPCKVASFHVSVRQVGDLRTVASLLTYACPAAMLRGVLE